MVPQGMYNVYPDLKQTFRIRSHQLPQHFVRKKQQPFFKEVPQFTNTASNVFRVAVSRNLTELCQEPEDKLLLAVADLGV